MKKSTFLFVCLSFLSSISTMVHAQITISKTDMPSSGQNFVLRGATSSTQDNYTLIGADQTWDFTHLTPTDSQSVECLPILSSALFAYAFTFSNPFDPNYVADYASKGAAIIPNGIPLPITISDLYNFYKKTNSNFSLIGLGASINSIPIPVKYDTVDVIYEFPLTYGNSFTGRSYYTFSLDTIGSYGQSRSRTTTVEGWGTLKLPNGMNYNVLKVKSVSNIVTHITSNSIPFPINFPSTSTEYKWISNDWAIPLLQINTNTLGGAETVSSIAFKYTPDYSGMAEQENSFFSLYPNPSQSQLNLNGYINRFQIVDALGKVLIESTNNKGIAIQQIDISNLQNGVYWIKGFSGNKFSNQKFVVSK